METESVSIYLESCLSNSLTGSINDAGRTMPAMPVKVAPKQETAGVTESQGLPVIVRDDSVMMIKHSEGNDALKSTCEELLIFFFFFF